ncbi:unnamed protein product [Bursaphelenchus xylophilus]|uniref:(pine wood nematode) hypothetical protein n=1 Tax=Bursaphelenchus xylophilus TaxID=6326 RepID=A0A1I7S6M5_BURXY|nr:unnamed protein product [Bursaphelenchus xylophilus]CAG9120577.1 unnamed protein product [Bursaphelenchus xylophilus]
MTGMNDWLFEIDEDVLNGTDGDALGDEAEASTSSSEQKKNGREDFGQLSLQEMSKKSLVPDVHCKKGAVENGNAESRGNDIFLKNFHSLLVTARAEIGRLKRKNIELEQKLVKSMAIECPACKHHFIANEHRILPKYVKVLHGAKKIELDFEDLNKLKEFLNVSGLDTDQNGVPTIPDDERKPQTLKEVDSKLLKSEKETKDRRSEERMLKERREREINRANASRKPSRDLTADERRCRERSSSPRRRSKERVERRTGVHGRLEKRVNGGRTDMRSVDRRTEKRPEENGKKDESRERLPVDDRPQKRAIQKQIEKRKEGVDSQKRPVDERARKRELDEREEQRRIDEKRLRDERTEKQPVDGRTERPRICAPTRTDDRQRSKDSKERKEEPVAKRSRPSHSRY